MCVSNKIPTKLFFWKEIKKEKEKEKDSGI